jgi:hypothetical protein
MDENDIKIGTKEEKYWTDLKDKLDNDNDLMAKQIAINGYVLQFVDEKIEKEKESLK